MILYDIHIHNDIILSLCEAVLGAKVRLASCRRHPLMDAVADLKGHKAQPGDAARPPEALIRDYLTAHPAVEQTAQDTLSRLDATSMFQAQTYLHCTFSCLLRATIWCEEHPWAHPRTSRKCILVLFGPFLPWINRNIKTKMNHEETMSPLAERASGPLAYLYVTLPDAHQEELVPAWSYRLFPTALQAASQGQAPALCSCLLPCLLSMCVPVATTQQHVLFHTVAWNSGHREFAELLQLISLKNRIKDLKM